MGTFQASRWGGRSLTSRLERLNSRDIVLMHFGLDVRRWIESKLDSGGLDSVRTVNEHHAAGLYVDEFSGNDEQGNGIWYPWTEEIAESQR